MTSSPVAAVVERGIAADAERSIRRGRLWPRRDPMDDGLTGLAALAGPANVIMELSRPAIGHAMVESRVESGRADRHPLKRARTTFTYLAVATMGTEEQKRAFRRAVNTAHAQVYSTPDSPVSYRAFDPQLQLWVAACLYKGAVDMYRLFVGEMDERTADEHYKAGMPLATTLQVPPHMWPADRAAFDEYWRTSLNEIHIDETVRRYLYPIAVARLAFPLPRRIRTPLERMALLITTGFLPQRFRDEMGLAWDARSQRRFDRLIGALRVVNGLLPRPIRHFPFNALLRDLDWRIKTGRPLV